MERRKKELKRGKGVVRFGFFFGWLDVGMLDHDHTDSILVFSMALWIGEIFSLCFKRPP